MPLMKSLFATALTVFGLSSAVAAPVSFSVSPISFVAGAGYGVDANEVGGTLLDVSFNAVPGFQGFVLNAPADSASLNFGSVTLNETGLINANETDDLGVLALFLFQQPFAGAQAVAASGTAVVGLVNDLDIDLTIAWNPLNVAFGNGGLFRITMDTLNFRLSGQTRDVTATVTLLNAPQPIPVPGTLVLALAGLALVNLVGVGRRGRRTESA